MIEESSGVMKKHFIKKHVMNKEDSEHFLNYTNCWICGNDYVDNDVKVRDQCHVIDKYRDSAHRYCNITLKINHKIPIVFHSLKIMILILL